MEKGMVQLYTGDGKGKTTAAFGQALRALGRGFRVIIIQFLKGEETGELLFAEQVPSLKVYRFNTQKKYPWAMNSSELDLLKEETLKGFDLCKKIIRNRECDMLVLDECIGAINRGFIPVDELKKIIDERPGGIEVVLTGRDASEEIIACADLVTEMKKIKHHFDRGITARNGIEK